MVTNIIRIPIFEKVYVIILMSNEYFYLEKINSQDFFNNPYSAHPHQELVFYSPKKMYFFFYEMLYF